MRLALLALICLSATANEEVIGFISPDDVDAAGAWMAKGDELVENLHALVDRCKDLKDASRVAVTPLARLLRRGRRAPRL